jgi:hypothetical protein
MKTWMFTLICLAALLIGSFIGTVVLAPSKSKPMVPQENTLYMPYHFTGTDIDGNASLISEDQKKRVYNLEESGLTLPPVFIIRDGNIIPVTGDMIRLPNDLTLENLEEPPVPPKEE